MLRVYTKQEKVLVVKMLKRAKEIIQHSGDSRVLRLEAALGHVLNFYTVMWSGMVASLGYAYIEQELVARLKGCENLQQWLEEKGLRPLEDKPKLYQCQLDLLDDLIREFSEFTPPHVTNSQRASRVDAALLAHANAVPPSYASDDLPGHHSTDLASLFADMLHWCVEHKVDIDEVERLAQHHFREERERDDES